MDSKSDSRSEPTPAYFGYPEAKQGSVPEICGHSSSLLNLPRPDISYQIERKNNPVLRGWALIVSAFLFVVFHLQETVLLFQGLYFQIGIV